MAVTPFEFPPLFRKPKNAEIPKILGVRAVVVDSSNNFPLTLQDILNPDLSLRSLPIAITVTLNHQGR